MPFLKAFCEVARDARRTISEVNGPNFSVQHFKVAARMPLGNHYHGKRVETFVVLAGGGRLVTRHVGLDGKGLEEPVEEAVSAGTVIRMPPYVSHTFILEPGSEMVCYSSIRFDPDDMDMVRDVLVAA